MIAQVLITIVCQDKPGIVNDFDKVRFTNVSDLSKDIQKLAQNSIAQTLEAMADDEVPR